MTAILKHINQQLPTEVPVITGAAEELVNCRELRIKYETNRTIKTWSCWFLLKALTSSGKIQQWTKQKEFILHYVQMSEKTFYTRLKELIDLQLLTVDDDGSIHLISYEKGAAALGITYTGLVNIKYNPNEHGGKQIFQYFLRAEEFRFQQSRQLDALTFHMDKNLSLKNHLHLLLIKAGADDQRLRKERRYFQERLLQLQMQLFKEGSEILQYVLTHRADINRGVGAIQRNHSYKSKQSVSYLKKRMFKLKVIQVEKICVESKARSRIYIPDGDKKRDGYKYIAPTRKTAWFLTDQINFNYESSVRKRSSKKAAIAA